MARFKQRDCTKDAVALFSRFVSRHGFTYEVDDKAPVEVMWIIPSQAGLSLSLVLGLQNSDELNFGIEEFWSYFFPFDDVAEEFEDILEKWVACDARILAVGWKGRILEVRNGDGWKIAYRANCWFSRKVKAVIQNDRTYSNSTIT